MNPMLIFACERLEVDSTAWRPCPGDQIAPGEGEDPAADRKAASFPR